ncbi:coiled-coil domain-containing protein 50 isoform X1 [Bufo gargarizans]|uniref:coiled-coil domain-containing protein 50 isoform X1 n=1 Tax=Bufo gargarizans TaxID=30331 RepID=UPI001CF43371|nr:coiled-coil domain-containing protein 50 isoform X1 [Bufo gargarizans]
MTEVTIDSSKLPGVKEVCRDFAVLEDHSLAHSLQEQEIEHHLATNVQRNRLVKHDLKVAKQLQEEEDLRAQAQIKHHQDELELLDGEIAQEIQEKLVIDAERKRLQEEKDKDIARILQEREEKRRKKYPPRSPEEHYHPDHEGHHRGRRKEPISEYDRPHRHERREQNRKERGTPKSERSSNYDEDDRKRGRSAEPRSLPRDNAYLPSHENQISKTSAKKDRPQRPPPPRTSKREDHDNENADELYPTENLPRRVRSQSHDLGTKHSDIREHQDSAHKRGTGGDHERRRRRTPSPQDERRYRESGHRSKGHRESPQTRIQDTRDAEIARRLQKEEIRVNTEDYRAAQLAQDEELARWLMEKEQQSYKKSKGREKTSDRKRPDERELSSYEHDRPRSRDEQHRSRSDKPYRPLPPAPDEDHGEDYGHDYQNLNPHNSPRSGSKSQSSHKGSHYRQ